MACPFLPKRAAFAFNANVDSLVFIKGSDLDGLALPASLSPLVDCMRRGISGEVRVDSSASEFIRRNFETVVEQAGGQAGIMAQAAAHLGVQAFLHANSKTTRLARLLHPHVFIASPRGFVSSAAFKREGVSRRHFIFEFQKGDLVFGRRIPASNRFIASFDPENFSMQVDREFERAFERDIERFPKAFVSGFHLISQSSMHRITSIQGLLRKWKALNPDLEVHLELGDFGGRSSVLRTVLRKIAPLCDCIGLNELELGECTRALSLGPGISALQGLLEFAPTAVLHTPLFQASVSREHGSARIKRSLEFGASAAAFRAQKNSFPTLASLARFAPSLQMVPPCVLKEFSGLKGASKAIAPSRKVSLERTVGLGDVFSTAFFLSL